MKAVLTAILPQSERSPTRVIASAEGGFRVVVGYDHGLEPVDNHKAALRKLCYGLDWTGTYVGGWLPNGSYAWVDSGLGSPRLTLEAEPKELWKDDAIQFPRLLAEIHASGLTGYQLVDLEKSAGLSPKEVEELLQRAEVAWENIKEAQRLLDMEVDYDGV